MSTNNSNRRVRNWCAIVYPDSAPSNWKEELDKLNIKWSCSPLHDKDIDDDGKLKKAHWHIIICYSGNKSIEQVIDDLQVLNCPRPEICRDVTGSVRYFTHRDHPHKYQYNVSDIEAHGGFDLESSLALSRSEKHEVLKDIMLYIRENDVVEFFDLVNYAMDEHAEDWYPLIMESYTHPLTNYIKSNRHRVRYCAEKDFDEETGEILD